MFTEPSIPQSETLELELLQTICNDREHICYFVELKGYVYLVEKLTCKIFIVKQDENEFKRIGEISCSIANYVPSGFTSSDTNNCLYLGSRHDKFSIYKIVPPVDGQEEKIERFLHVERQYGERPQSLSTASRGRLLVLMALESSFQRTWKGRLDIYWKDGTLHLRIPIPRSIINPWCVTYIDKTYAITYGLFNFGVIRLDMEGKKLAQVTAGFSLPRCIRFDNRKNVLYVVDAGHYRLLELDENLVIKSVIHTWNDGTEDNEDQLPIRIVLSANGSRMLIGLDSGKINLYAVKDKNQHQPEAIPGTNDA